MVEKPRASGIPSLSILSLSVLGERAQWLARGSSVFHNDILPLERFRDLRFAVHDPRSALLNSILCLLSQCISSAWLTVDSAIVGVATLRCAVARETGQGSRGPRTGRGYRAGGGEECVYSTELKTLLNVINESLNLSLLDQFYDPRPTRRVIAGGGCAVTPRNAMLMHFKASRRAITLPNSCKFMMLHAYESIFP